MRECGYCGSEFQPAATGPGKDRKFCSDRCRRDHYVHGEVDRCCECGGPMPDRRGSTTRRCATCREQAESRRLHERAERIVAWWAEGLTLQEIADHLGWTQGHVGVEMVRLRKAGYDLPLRHDGHDAEVMAETARLYASGLSAQQIGDRMGHTGPCIRKRLIRLGVERRTPREALRLRREAA